MNTLNRTIIISAAVLAFGLPCRAQQDTTINRQVEVVKAYQPSISDAYRISSVPRIVDTVQYAPVFEYHINSVPVVAKKTVQNLPCVKLGNMPFERANKGYLRGGFGTALTPYGEIFFNTAVTSKTDFGFQVLHHSSRPDISLNDGTEVEAPYSNNFGRIFVKNYFKNSVLDWDLQYNRNRYNYYGYVVPQASESNIQSGIMRDEKQVLNFASAHVALSSMTAASRPNYKVGIDYDYLWNLSNQTAHVGTLKAAYDRRIGANRFSVDALLGYYAQQSIENVYIDSDSRSMFNVELAPQIEFDGSNWGLDLGFKAATIAANDTSARYHLSPKIDFEFYPIKDIMTLFVTVDGNLKSNNYMEMIRNNRYLTPNSDVRSTNEILDIRGGIEGKISTSISYLFDVEYDLAYDEAFYVLKQDIAAYGPQIRNNTFDLVYDDVNTLRFGGKIRYSGRSLNIGLGGDFYKSQMKTLPEPFLLPLFELMADASYTFKIAGSDLTLGADAQFIGPRSGAILNNTYNADGSLNTSNFVLIDMENIIELDFNAQYDLTKRLAFFLQANNLLNCKHDYYLGYNHQGINFMLGARYAF